MKFSGTQPVSQEGISFSSTCRGRSVAVLWYHFCDVAVLMHARATVFVDLADF